MTRATAIAAFERRAATVLEVDVDTCANSYGASPCTAGITTSGTAVDALPDTLTLAAGASAVADAYNDQVIRLTGGTGEGQERTVIDYAEATNLLTYSEQFDNAAWTKSNSTVSANAATAPDGSATADKLVENAAASTTHSVARTSVVSPTVIGTTYAFAIRAKAAERSVLVVQFNNLAFGGGAAPTVWFDLSAVSATKFSGTFDDYGIESTSDGWVTVFVSKQASVASNLNVTLYLDTSPTGTAIYTGDGASGLYLWGAQMNAATLGPYVATTSASATGKVATLDRAWLTNLQVWSEDFTNAAWTKDGTSVSGNAAASPLGDQTADLITATGGNRRIYDVSSVVNGATYTTCFHVKQQVGGAVRFSLINIADSTTNFNFSTGVLTVATPFSGGTVSALEDGWYRISLTWTSTVSSAAVAVNFYNDADAILAWGASIEQGSVAGKYIATGATAVTLPDATTTYAVINRPNACRNTINTCQDRANYSRSVRTVSFISRGIAPPAGETLRPYLEKEQFTPTEIDTEKGLANRGSARITLVDEPCRDDLDPYIAHRATVAGGTFWQRFVARNPNVIGRPARVRRGFVVSPWDWSTFQTETHIVESLKGPDASGKVTLQLADAVKLLDRAKIPVAVDGKLAAELLAYSHIGTAASGTSTTVVLPAGASPLDDAYNGQEIYLTQNTGAGQRRTISDYVGASRTATVSAWSVTPDSTTTYEISPLSLQLEADQGAQYPDPVATGMRQWVRVKDEVIEYTAKSGDVLSWDSSAYRAQFGTERLYPETRDNGTKQAAKAGDAVVLCRAFVEEAPADVIEALLNEGGVVDANIDLTGLAQTCTDWLSLNAEITACLASPETASTLLKELLQDLGLMVWWDAVAGQVRFKADRPAPDDTVATRTDDAWIDESMAIDRDDAARITQVAVDYALRSPVAKRDQSSEYLATEVVVDADAESVNEYGDTRPETRRSRWMTLANRTLVRALSRRRLAARRDAPGQYTARLDPRDEVAIGDLVDVTCAQVTNVHGEPVTIRCRVTRVLDDGDGQAVRLESTRYRASYIDAAGVERRRRYGFIAPAGTPDYTSASAAEQARYAFICGAAGSMSNGDDPYLIL